MSDTAPLPLAGVRVLELGNYIAAPTAGRLLADFGAEVIKIERPLVGDELRNWRLYEGTTSMLFRTVNRNKKSVVLDLRTDEGKQTVLALAATCDVVLENFRPGTLEKWGLGPNELTSVNPDLVITRISAFGQTGPLSGKPGFAAVAEAVGGMRELVGDPDRPPVRVGVSIGDSIAGLYAAFGTVMALFQRQILDGHTLPLVARTIDVALNESILSMMESLVPDRSAYGVTRTRTGGRMEGIAPSNAYVCSDGRSIIVAANADSIFGRCMRVIGRDDLAQDQGLATNAGRWERRDELDIVIGGWAGSLTRDEALAILDEAEVPAGPIYTAEDIISDPQYLSRNMIQKIPVEITNGRIEDVAFSGIVPVIGERSIDIESAGPDLGEHTAEVLASLESFAKHAPSQ
ncbi:CoA transferase [Rhodococcus sp. B10]|uniref:CoA transferase n=1 Tax=Rhodococcus sp. B10 TaxID=2695876 RepID=UPI0014318CDA